MKPLISVIVPVYNVEKFLEKCIKSIINQTYDNTEIILINDGSTDTSGNICDSFSEKDNRIKVVHKANSGVADTRNHGVSISKGEYYCFIDSDDYIAKDYIEQLYNAITEHNADISCCSFNYEFPDGRTYSPLCKDKDLNYFKVVSGPSILENMLYGKSEFQPACFCKLYKRSAIGNISFPRYKIGEDFLAAIDFFSKADKVVFINKPLYFYYQNSNSVMHSNDPKKLFDMVLSSEEIYRSALKINQKLKNAAAHYVIEMNMIVLMKLQHSEEHEIINHVKNNIKLNRIPVIFDKNARPRIKISCIVSLLGFNALCKIRNLTTK